MEDILLQLYNNPDISLGIHGTAVIKGKEVETASKIIKEGLMCRYGDIRRTVAFQNKGQIHAHGNIEYEELINYKYGNDRKGYINEKKQEGKLTTYLPKEVELEQISIILAIPDAMKTTDEDIFSSPKKKYSMDYAKSESDLSLGKYKDLEGRAINPKYIVGYYINGDISTFKFNDIFYGFKQIDEKSGMPILDLEAISNLNEETKEKYKAIQEKSVQELGKETIENQKDTNGKKGIMDLIKGILKSRNKTQENEIKETRDD